ncbi:MAG: SMP-30/gluconolactonase/LRE family protein [Pirellulaceae bacterium]|nr:SMP-30/gluconolactonase/LRE family protein [Pirellulaceae bacterium]
MPTACRFLTWVVLWLTVGWFSPALAQTEYPLTDDSKRQPAVPMGKLAGPFNLSSNIFPGTQRKYWVYVPSQYDPQKPACSLIVQDGLRRAEEWHLPEVIDNLIHKKEIPVMLGIFVDPGEVPPINPEARPRLNRSFEYDALGDRYARFLIEELLPEVSKSYALSTDANDRALAGASSGGICAFNAAWERPDAFRRVISTIGTFVGLRGGNQFSMLVRKTEPRPLKVFLQDGRADLNIYGGDWWTANQDMLSALKYAGYEVEHVWGEGGHNGQHGAAIMPDALRWLWKGYPEPVKIAPNPVEPRRLEVLVPGAGWELVSSGHELVEAPACNVAGDVFFCDSRAGRIYRSGLDGKTRVFAEQTGRVSGMAFGPDNKLYACQSGRRRIVRYTDAGQEEVVYADTACHDLVTLPKGFYYTDPVAPGVWYSDYAGNRRKVDELTPAPMGLCPTADQAFLHLSSADASVTYHFRAKPDGELEFRQPLGYLHAPPGEGAAGASSMAIDTAGRLFVATKLGIQVLDQLGRTNLILSKPSSASISGVAFGGTDFDTLFVTCGERVYRRKLKIKGALTHAAPVIPPKADL